MTKKIAAISLVFIRRTVFALGCLVAIGILPPCARGQEAPLPARDLHVWGRFGPNTWKRARLVSETLGPNGEVTGVTATETTTTLVRVGSESVTLKIDVTVEVGGKRFQGQSQVVECGYLGDETKGQAKIRNVGFTQLMVDGRQVPCQVRQVTTESDKCKRTTQIYVSNEVEPFVLKRETVPSDDESTDENSTTVEVIALDMPYNVLGEHKTAAFERTIHKTDRGTSVTLDVTCIDVPGGTVARTTKELDPQGRIVRRSTLELVDYQAVMDEDDGDGPRYLSRRQVRKARRGK